MVFMVIVLEPVFWVIFVVLLFVEMNPTTLFQFDSNSSVYCVVKLEKSYNLNSGIKE